MYQTIVEAILDHAKYRGARKALIMKKEMADYAGLAKLMRKSAKVLRSKYHIHTGDKVMITALSKPEFFAAFLGVQYLHGVTIPIDRSWHMDTLMKMAAFVRPELIISNRAIGEMDVQWTGLNELYREIVEADEESFEGYLIPEEEQVAEMLFTTGTTGPPKGVMLTYGNILSITRNNIEGVGFREDDVVLDALPLCHSLGLREARMVLFSGGTLVLQNGFSFLKELCHNIVVHQCTGFVCIPAVMEKLVRSLPDFEKIFSRLRYMEVGAGSLSYDLKKRLPVMLPDTDIFNVWGSSETGGVIYLDVRRRQDKIAALGKAVTAARIRIIGQDGRQIRACDINHAGRMSIYGKMNMAGYYLLPEASREALADGWLYTNDLVYMDEEDFIYMIGRADDIINVGGEKVSPFEVESAATEFASVRDAACIGVEDPGGIMGQVPVLYVETDGEEPFPEEQLMRFLSGRLENFKLPKKIMYIREIPRNRMKKIDRNEIRKLWKAGQGSDSDL